MQITIFGKLRNVIIPKGYGAVASGRVQGTDLVYNARTNTFGAPLTSNPGILAQQCHLVIRKTISDTPDPEGCAECGELWCAEDCIKGDEHFRCDRSPCGECMSADVDRLMMEGK